MHATLILREFVFLKKHGEAGAMPASIREIRLADSILVTGSAVTETVPILALEIKAAVRKYDSRLVIVDSQKSDLGRFCIYMAAAPARVRKIRFSRA